MFQPTAAVYRGDVQGPGWRVSAGVRRSVCPHAHAVFAAQGADGSDQSRTVHR